jgi:hypothetical protein
MELLLQILIHIERVFMNINRLSRKIYFIIVVVSIINCKGSDNTDSQGSSSDAGLSITDKGIVSLLTAINSNTYAQNAINHAGTEEVFNCPDGGTTTLNVPASFLSTDPVDVLFTSCKVMGDHDTDLCGTPKPVVLDGKVTYTKMTPLVGSTTEYFSLKGTLNYSTTVTGSCSFDAIIEGYEEGNEVYLKWTGTLCGEVYDILKDYVYRSKVCSYLSNK